MATVVEKVSVTFNVHLLKLDNSNNYFARFKIGNGWRTLTTGTSIMQDAQVEALRICYETELRLELERIAEPKRLKLYNKNKERKEKAKQEKVKQ